MNNYHIHIRHFLLIVITVALTTSCKKLLERKTDKTLVIPSTISDLQGLLDYTILMNESVTPAYGEASSNEYFLKDVDYNYYSEALQSIYTWTYYPMNYGNDWSQGYKAIYNTNLSLDILKSIPQTISNFDAWNNVKGSALFFRSYYFLGLLWTYAKAYDSTTADKDLGIALRLTSDWNIPSTRANIQDCYRRVIEDTKASISLLPTYPRHVMRPSKAAAYGLLSRCYLSMRAYGEALLYADSCLQLNNALVDFNADDHINNLTASYFFKAYNKEVIFYTEMYASPSIYRTNSRSRIDTFLYTSYSENDLRKVGFFKLNADGYHQFKGSYSGSSYCFSGISTGEMYLTRAECFVRMGKIQQGLDDLNTLLVKRYATGTFMPVTATSRSVALDKILNERKKELVMRGMCWMDIKRLNKEGYGIVLHRFVNGKEYTLQPNANFYALPLPDDVIKQTGMQQNDL